MLGGEQAVVTGEAEVRLLHDLGCLLAWDLYHLGDSDLHQHLGDAFDKVRDVPFEKRIVVRKKSLDDALGVARKITQHLQELSEGKTLAQAVDDELRLLRRVIVEGVDGPFKYVEPDPPADVKAEATPAPPLECGACLRSVSCRRSKDRLRCDDYEQVPSAPPYLRPREILQPAAAPMAAKAKRRENQRIAWPMPPKGCDFAVETRTEELLGFFPDKSAANAFLIKTPKAWAIWRISDWAKLSTRGKE